MQRGTLAEVQLFGARKGVVSGVEAHAYPRAEPRSDISGLRESWGPHTDSDRPLYAPQVHLDSKQSRLINAWLAFGADGRDDYGKFIAVWVAFNAVCYAQFAPVANRLRADLDKDRGLRDASEEPIALSGTMKKTGAKIRLDLTLPGPIRLTVSERYTEDILFSEFATTYAADYRRWLGHDRFHSDVAALHTAITKHDGQAYVLNMSRADDVMSIRDIKELRNRNIIVPWDEVDSLQQLKNVLYQIRCNVFHGEKTPGEVNDDRIVRAAHPVLLHLVRQVLAQVGECAG